VNEPKSARYHRLDRRVACAALIGTAGVLVFLLVSGTSIVIRDLSAGSAAGYALVLWLVLQGVTLPASWYRGVYLERQFGLSRVSAVAWARDQGKAGLLTLMAAAAGAEVLYGTIRLFPSLWWVAAAGAGAVSAALLTTVAPLLLVALFHRSRPVTREALRHRLVDLARRAGVGVLGVHECGIGEDTARASAALVGAGRTRRILLSEALLTEYSDDEIEVVLAHEMGHHVHRDILQGLLARGGVLLAACLVAAAALNGGTAPDSTGDRSGGPGRCTCAERALPRARAARRQVRAEPRLPSGRVRRCGAANGCPEPGGGTPVPGCPVAVSHAPAHRGPDPGGE
jgi:STE24 endopeptidase